MNKDKEIEQLEKEIRTINCLQASTIYTPTYQEALCLYNLGYRKIDKVIEKISKKLANDFYCPNLCSTRKLEMQEYCDNHTCSTNNQECWQRYLEKIIKGE